MTPPVINNVTVVMAFISLIEYVSFSNFMHSVIIRKPSHSSNISIEALCCIPVSHLVLRVDR